MKVCVSWVKSYNKPSPYLIRQALVKELIEIGIPNEVAELIAHQDSIVWRDWEMDGDVIFTAQILPDPVSED